MSQPSIQELRKKYEEEKNKRLRTEGTSQYQQLSSKYPEPITDPYRPVKPRTSRQEHRQAIITGGGLAGLLAAARLRQAGLEPEDILIIEKGGDVGGTWYWNRYPGAACDIESYIYFPLLEETGYIPSEKYAKAKEIHAYCQLIIKHFGLEESCCFHTKIESSTWCSEHKTWEVKTDRSDIFTSNFFIVSSAPLHHPKLPKIPGMDDFKGHSFHTSLWDYQYTGGNLDGGLEKLKGKKVAIVGTGATAVQCVPHLAETSQQLYVFQRTPSSIDNRLDQPTDMKWAESLQPGWHKHRMENFNNLVTGAYEKEDLVNDGWTDIVRNLVHKYHQNGQRPESMEALMELMEVADSEKMQQIRDRVDQELNDPETAEKLKPWYRQFCKRPCFHNSYLSCFNQENVSLIDTQGKGIEKIDATGIWANGQHIEVDCIIWSTGFVVGGDLNERNRAPQFDIIGKNSNSLKNEWSEQIRSFHGIMVENFPNLFILSGPQGGFTVNFPHNLTEQAEYVARIIARINKQGKQTIEPSSQAEKQWGDLIESKAVISEQFQASCTPGYYNNEGQSIKNASRRVAYGGGGGGSREYFQLIKQWSQSDELVGVDLQ